MISYASVKFSLAETRYHCNEQECLAVIWAIKKYRPYLHDRSFILRTVSRILTWLNQRKDSKSKLTHWHTFLSEFSFQIEHIAGTSRTLYQDGRISSKNRPANMTWKGWFATHMIPLYPSPRGLTVPVVHALYTLSLLEEISEQQQSDALITKQMNQWLELHTSGTSNPRELDFYENNILDKRAEVTLRSIRPHFFWPGMGRYVKRMCPNVTHDSA